MFPQPMHEWAIIADMAERKRRYETDPRLESYRWFDQPKSIRPNWVRTALWHLGHILVFIGHQLENGASNLATVPTKQLKSM